MSYSCWASNNPTLWADSDYTIQKCSR